MIILKNTILLFLFTSTILFAQGWAKLGSDIDGASANDLSGTSVSLSSDGTIVAIGAPNGGGNGHVRVYSFNGSNWIQLGGNIVGEVVGDKFGTSVSLSSDGSIIAVGDPANSGNGLGAGHVRVYSFNGSNWVQLGNDIDGEAEDDYSGESVSLSSDGLRVAIGAAANGLLINGHVRVFSYNGTDWTQIGDDINGIQAVERSGESVSLSSDGTIVAIGAPFFDSMGNADVGCVRVYSESGGIWNQVGSDIVGNGESGASVSISSDGKRIAFGTIYSYITGGGNLGSASIYSEIGGVWNQVGNDIVGTVPAQGFGASVSLSSDGSSVAIGCPAGSTSGLPGGSIFISNHVGIYSETGGVWLQVGNYIEGEAAGDRFGRSVSLSSDGTRVSIGAPKNDGADTDAGHTRIYFLDAALPVELGYFNANNSLQGVLCEWKTESEIENLGFLLERKTDETNWTEIVSYKTVNGLLGQGTTSSPTNYEYLDKLVEANTTYEYRLADVDYNGVETYHSTRPVTVEQTPLNTKVDEFTVLPAYPNPFNPSTTIRYGLEQNGRVIVQIYDISGKLIATLANEEQSKGWHNVRWNATNQHGEKVPAGIYLSRISSNSKVKTSKLMLLK